MNDTTWFHMFGGHDSLNRSPLSSYLGFEQGLPKMWQFIRQQHLIWAELFAYNPKGPLEKFGYLAYEVISSENNRRIVEGRIVCPENEIIVMEVFHQTWKSADESPQTYLWAMGTDPIKMQHPQRLSMYSGIPYNGEWVSDPL